MTCTQGTGWYDYGSPDRIFIGVNLQQKIATLNPLRLINDNVRTCTNESIWTIDYLADAECGRYFQIRPGPRTIKDFLIGETKGGVSHGQGWYGG